MISARCLIFKCEHVWIKGIKEARDRKGKNALATYSQDKPFQG